MYKNQSLETQNRNECLSQLESESFLSIEVKRKDHESVVDFISLVSKHLFFAKIKTWRCVCVHEDQWLWIVRTKKVGNSL